ncbi:MAG: hypothetical protein ABI678_03475 [Kofleriaceae bacterium]
MRLPVLALLAACAGATIPAARFAARSEWTPAAYALGPHAAPPAEVDRDDMIEDIAFLEHAMDEAWPAQVTSTPEYARLLRDRARELPRGGGKSTEAFCDELAEAYRSAGFVVAFDGERCGSPRVHPGPPIRAAIPADRNYAWHRDGAVGVLAIQRFAPPQDPGWTGFPDALHELAATGVAVIDLQAATGDDPRVGFGVLAALGLETFTRNPPRPMVARDTPLAEVVRRNHQKLHPDATARPRALWQGFSAAAAIRAANPLPITRPAPAVKIAVVVGTGCDRACQLIASLAQFQMLVELASTTGVEDQLNGDEPGTLRLPHSGLEVTFPTVAYGTVYGGGVFGSHGAGVDLVKAEVSALQRVADQRAEHDHWNDAALPDCRELPVDDAALRTKRSGCFKDQPQTSVSLILSLGDARTRTFIESCGLTVGSIISNPNEGETIATASGSYDAVQRLSHAPFVRMVEWDCPMHLD